MESRWMERLRLPLAYILASLLTMAMFGALLAAFWAVVPDSSTLWREGSVWLAAALATVGGGAVVAWLARSRRFLLAGIFGALLAAPSSLYILGPNWKVPLIGFAFGLTAVVGAAIAQRWEPSERVRAVS
ncbi:MAG: hypothetical protein WBR18_13040 [Anaerolineales bacterium]